MTQCKQWWKVFGVLVLAVFSQAAFSASAADAQGGGGSPLVVGIVQLASGHPVVGARISAETPSGRKLPLRRKIGATTDRGGYYLETVGLPKRFVVVAEGGSVHWRENGQAREQPLKGAMRAVVTLDQNASKTAQTAMLSLGTTTEVAIYRRLGQKDLARAAELTRQALGWPSWARLGFDDRVNDDFVLGSKVLEAMRANGGWKALAAKIAKQGVRGKTFLVPYGGDSLLAPSPQAAVERLAAHGLSTPQSRAQPRELTATPNAWYNYCVPVPFGKEPALSYTQCTASIVLTLLGHRSERAKDEQIEASIQNFIAQAQADFESLQDQISDLQMSLDRDFAVQTYEAYSSLAAITVGNNIMSQLEAIQVATALPCEPPGTGVSSVNPAPCGALTYQTSTLLNELNPSNASGFFGGDNPVGAQSFQDQIMGGTASAQGALYFGQQAIWAGMKAGLGAMKGIPTSLYTNSMSLGVWGLEQTWYTLMGNLAMLNAQYYAYEQWPVLEQTVTDAQTFQSAIQTLQSEIGAQLQIYGYLATTSSPGTLGEQQLSWAQVIPPNSLIDPSTGLMWWNTSGVINADGLTVTTTAFANTDEKNCSVNNWVNSVNGMEPGYGGTRTNPCPLAQVPTPQSGKNGTGPACSSLTTGCAGELSNQWAMPSLNYIFQGFGKNPPPSGSDCKPYTGSEAFGGLWNGDGSVGSSAGLFGSIWPTVGAGAMETALATVAAGVFPNIGALTAVIPPLAQTPPVPLDPYTPVSLGWECDGTTGSTPYTVMYAQFNMTCSGSASECNGTEVSHPNNNDNSLWFYTCLLPGPLGTKSDGLCAEVLPVNGIGYLADFSPNFLTPAQALGAGQPGASGSYLASQGSTGLVVLTKPVTTACYTWPVASSGCPASGWSPPAPVGAPANFIANVTAATPAGEVPLSWTAPTDAGGAAVTSYNLQYSSNPGAASPSWQTAGEAIAGTSFVVTGLEPCVVYTFRIQATNAAAMSGSDAVTTATPNGTVPTPCTPTALYAIPQNAQAQLSWLAPAWTGGSSMVSYVVQYSGDNGSNWTTMPGSVSTTEATVTGLVNRTIYLFRVAGINAEGAQSGWSATASATLSGTTPGAPTGVSPLAGNGLVVLSWTPPAYTGGASITGYWVRYSSDNGTNWTQVPSPVANTQTVVSGLTNGISYVFDVAAINAFNEQGPWSEMSLPVIPVGGSSGAAQ